MITPIATRARWGARHDDGDLDLTGLALEVFAHHSVTAQLSPAASIEAECEQMRELEAIGESRFGTGISYNVVIFPSGRPYQGVSWDRRGTHTGGRNSTARSICFAGNYEENQPTAAQLATAAAIYADGKGELWRVDAPLRGHRDVKETACPGEYVYAQLPAIRAGRIAQEDDMTPEESDRLEAVETDVAKILKILTDPLEDGNQQVPPRTIWRRAVALPRRIEAAVLAGRSVELDADAVRVIAEAIPNDIAQQVADTLYARLAQ